MTNRIKYILGLMTICILGVILTQGFWLYKDYKYYAGQPLLSSDFDVLLPTFQPVSSSMAPLIAPSGREKSATAKEIHLIPRIEIMEPSASLVAVAMVSASPATIPVAGHDDTAQHSPFSQTRLLQISKGKTQYYNLSETEPAKVYKAIPFKAPVLYVLQKMKLQFGISFLLILVTTLCIVYMLITIFSQRKLSIVKNDMINKMTHELKTPLSTVSVAIEALQNYEVLADKDKTDLYLEVSKNEVDHLSRLVEMILDLSIFEAQKMVLFKKKINVTLLIEDIIKKHTLSGINLQLDSSDHIPDLLADPVHLRNAIENLIENAIKYALEHPDIHIVSMFNKRMWTLIIRDNGIGIPETYQKSVFDQFFRVPERMHKRVKGYGLGLSYVKQVVERHEGTISLYSQEGRGSTFTILIPVR